jgi:hypothetical protein
LREKRHRSLNRLGCPLRGVAEQDPRPVVGSLQGGEMAGVTEGNVAGAGDRFDVRLGRDQSSSP